MRTILWLFLLITLALSQASTDLIYQSIDKYSRMKYPNNKEMRDYTYKEQLEAAFQMSDWLNANSDFLSAIVRHYMEENLDVKTKTMDLTLVVYQVNESIAAAKKVFKLLEKYPETSSQYKVVKLAIIKWTNAEDNFVDFPMIVYEVKQKLAPKNLRIQK